MSYEDKSIRDIINQIGRNEIYLPAIQRKFVWSIDQISNLFDSILRGYPIGTFLFWFIHGEQIEEYTFYKFLQEYHERDKYLNDIAPKPELKKDIIGVLDGQQRLSSMYIALQGTYAYKKKYSKRSSDNAFPRRKFYINLLYKQNEDSGEENNNIFEFKFLTEEEAKSLNDSELWFLVSSVLNWGIDAKIDETYDELVEGNSKERKSVIEEMRSEIKRTLRIMHQRFVLEKLISYFKIEEQDLDHVLDIFVRVNSGGTVLSKSDLLFSTIVASWQEGRLEIEDYLKSLNRKGNGFYFNTDFIMRSSLVLTDCPVLFKVRNFNNANVKKIKQEWANIKSAISSTVDILVEFGFDGETLTSNNAVLPIAYYLNKGGIINSTTKGEIRKYLIHALLKQIYGSQGDQVLGSIRDKLRKKQELKTGAETEIIYELRSKNFSFNDISDIKFSGNKEFNISLADLEDILDSKKGPYSFMVLSLLYPNLKFNQINFHQDHIHPTSQFSNTNLKKANIDQGKWQKWQELNDCLPNLQLMEGNENITKNGTPLMQWLEKNNVDVDRFVSDNYIPANVSLDISHFEEFYNKRREVLKSVLIKKLDTKSPI